MTERGSNRWIILLNRSPRGPFDDEEIRTLLGQSIIRKNDLALQVDSQNPKNSSGWKFLWQFPQFGDSSTEVSDLNSSVEPAAPPPSVELPKELLDISPEELILSSKKNVSLTEIEEPVTNDFQTKKTSKHAMRWLYATAIAIAVCVLLISENMRVLIPTRSPSNADGFVAPTIVAPSPGLPSGNLVKPREQKISPAVTPSPTLPEARTDFRDNRAFDSLDKARDSYRGSDELDDLREEESRSMDASENGIVPPRRVGPTPIRPSSQNRAPQTSETDDENLPLDPRSNLDRDTD